MINKPTQLIKANTFYERLSISRSKFYAMIKLGEIPKGIEKDYPRRTFWFEHEADYFIEKFVSAKSSEDYKSITQEILQQRSNSFI